MIYLYGAGRVANRYLGYLKKMNISIQGLVVTNIDGHNKKNFDGVSLICVDMIQDLESTGIILGLSPLNACEVKGYLNEKRFNGGIFSEYIKG